MSRGTTSRPMLCGLGLSQQRMGGSKAALYGGQIVWESKDEDIKVYATFDRAAMECIKLLVVPKYYIFSII